MSLTSYRAAPPRVNFFCLERWPGSAFCLHAPNCRSPLGGLLVVISRPALIFFALNVGLVALFV